MISNRSICLGISLSFYYKIWFCCCISYEHWTTCTVEGSCRYHRPCIHEVEKSGTSDTDSVKILVWLQHRFNRIVMNLLGLLRLQDEVLIQTTFVVDFVQYHMPFPSLRHENQLLTTILLGLLISLLQGKDKCMADLTDTNGFDDGFVCLPLRNSRLKIIELGWRNVRLYYDFAGRKAKLVRLHLKGSFCNLIVLPWKLHFWCYRSCPAWIFVNRIRIVQTSTKFGDIVLYTPCDLNRVQTYFLNNPFQSNQQRLSELRDKCKTFLQRLFDNWR